jgi:Bacterial protein of unknown function (DUF916)
MDEVLQRMSQVLKYGAVTLCVLLLTTSTTFAQESTAGMTISPAVVEPDKTLDPGSVSEYDVTVKNLNQSEQTFYLSVKNISGVAGEGTPIFSENNGEKTGMELADWVTLSTTQITLPPGVSERVGFTINVPTDAAPGSHFGSVFISVDPPEIQNSGAAVGYRVANIISIRVTGDADESANIRQFSTDRYFNGSKNIQFLARIVNTGNVLVKPSGPVEIKNMLGQTVDTFIFNENKNAVFPKSDREYKFTWTGEGTGFGRYEAVLSPVYGDAGAKMTMSSTVSFWILPLNIILPALGILTAVLLTTFIFVRLYIRRTLAHLSQGQGRIVRRRKQKGVSGTLLLAVVMLTVTAVFMIALLVLFA